MEARSIYNEACTFPKDKNMVFHAMLFYDGSAFCADPTMDRVLHRRTVPWISWVNFQAFTRVTTDRV